MNATIREAFETLKTGGFYVSVPGFFNVNNSAEAELFSADPASFYAQKHGVTRERFIAFEEFHSELPQCTGVTVRGGRCRNGPMDCCSEPQTFIPGRSDRCAIHQEEVRL